MFVRDRMSPDPITITRDTTIASALQLMRENKVRRLPVLEGNRLVGIVTDRDLSEVSPSPATTLSIFELNYLLAKSKIGDILPKNMQVITIGPDAFLEEAALLMRDNKIGAIPVMEKGVLIGIITETNLFDAFIDIMGLRQEGYRITIKLSEDRPGVLASITQAIASCGGNITHSTSYGEGNNAMLVFRIDKGDANQIVSAIRQLGYEATVHPTNNGTQ